MDAASGATVMIANRGRPLHIVVAVAAAFCAVAFVNRPRTDAAAAAFADGLSAPVVYPGALIAIADLHGDLHKAKQALQLVSIVDSDGKWTAEHVTVVQMGDLVDRGPSSLDVISYMHDLQDQALQHHSQLVLLLGNHELMNLRGDFRYVAPEELIRLGQQQQQQQQQQEPAKSTSRAAAHSREQKLDTDVASTSARVQPAVDDTDAYLAGLQIWAKLWRRPVVDTSTVQNASAPQDNSAVDGSTTASDSAVNTPDETATAAGGTGSSGLVHASVIARHQLITVQGSGPCATAFVHAGLLPQALQELKQLADGMVLPPNNMQQQMNLASESTKPPTDSISISSSDSANGTWPETVHQTQLDGAVQTDAADHSLRQTAQTPGHSSQSSSGQHDQHKHRPEVVGVVTVKELQAVNNLTRQALATCTGRACTGQSHQMQRIMKLLSSGYGPIWSRHQAQGRESKICAHLQQVLQQLGVHRLVVGHTPQVTGRATARCGGKLLLLDTGMSVGMADSPPAAWLCQSGVSVNVDAEGSSISHIRHGSSIGSDDLDRTPDRSDLELSNVSDHTSQAFAGSASDVAEKPDTGEASAAHTYSSEHAMQSLAPTSSAEQQKACYSVVVYADGVQCA